MISLKNLPEDIENIIKNYVQQLFFSEHKKKYQKVMKEISELNICICSDSCFGECDCKCGFCNFLRIHNVGYQIDTIYNDNESDESSNDSYYELSSDDSDYDD